MEVANANRIETLLSNLLEESKRNKEEIRRLRNEVSVLRHLSDFDDDRFDPLGVKARETITNKLKEAITKRDHSTFMRTYKQGAWLCKTFTPLTYFCTKATGKNGSFETEMMKWFIVEKFDMNEIDPSGFAPLHCAKSSVVVTFLCHHGADPNIQTPRSGTRPLQLCLANSEPSLAVKILIDYGANIYATDDEGNSCYSKLKSPLKEQLVDYFSETSKRRAYSPFAT